MNDQLLDLYNRYWPDLVEAAKAFENTAKSKQPSNPLLIKVDEGYESAKLKVMIVGQETDKWKQTFKDNPCSVAALMGGYYDYFQKVLVGKDKKISNRRFWNRSNFRYFKENLEREFGKNNIGYVWNNLSKIGKNSRGQVTPDIEALESDYFNVLSQELRILKPDVIIFNTSYTRDCQLAEKLCVTIEDAGYSENKKAIAKVNFEQGYQHIIAYRTFHPNARAHVTSRKDRNSYITQKIINDIKQLKLIQ